MRNLKLEQEQEKNKILSEALQTLASEHHELEQSLVKGTPPHHSILSEDEFYDAASGMFSSVFMLEDPLLLFTDDKHIYNDHCGVLTAYLLLMDQ